MENGNPIYRESIAKAKAMGSLGLGVDSANMNKMAADRPHFMNAVYSMHQNIIPVAGGVVIRDPKTNEVLGAVGISGDVSEKDEWCAVEGIKHVGLSCQAIKENREPFIKAHL